MSEKITYSFVLPVHNEAGNLPELHKRLTKVAKSLSKPYEIIYVENRSTDNTIDVLKTLKNAKIIIMRVAQKGASTQSVALDLGIKSSQGEIIITLDADLQNPPEEIPKLLNEMKQKNLDIVSGWRKNRQDKKNIVILSKFGSWLRKIVIDPGVHDLGCTLKVYKSECFEHIDLFGEMHRYLVAILKSKGFTIGEVVIKHDERKYGKSAYSWNKLFRGFTDMLYIWFLSKYSDRPLHFLGVIGLITTIGSSIILVLLGILRLLKIIQLSNSIWPLVSVLGIITGLQMLAFGVLMDLVLRNYFTIGKEKRYGIKEVIINK